MNLVSGKFLAKTSRAAGNLTKTASSTNLSVSTGDQAAFAYSFTK
jgi:hypothetical protein